MKTKLISLVLGSVLALHGGLASAQDDKGPSPAVIEQLDIVNKLIAMGDARKDPLLLLAAASMQKQMGTEGASLPTKSTAPQDVLDRAKALAGNRKDLVGIADDLSAVKSKGASWRIDAVTGRSTYRY
jgi:hypothetical protein